MPGGIHPSVEQWLAWPKPNYIDPPTRPKFVLILSCIIGPLSVVLLCARLWVRIRIHRNPGLDDWLMLASMFPVLALTVIIPLVTEAYSFNRHVWDVEWKWFPVQRSYLMAIYSLFCLASGLIKISILLFYRRLTSRAVSPAYRWTLRLTIASIGLYTLVYIFIPIFLCNPISAFWDQLDINLIAKGYQYKCGNEGAIAVANGVISTVQDFVAAFFPTLLCWRLQMPMSQKLALYAVFAVSYMTVIIGALRTYSCYRIFFETYDVTWVVSDTWLWTLLELHIGSMCANAPALKVIWTEVFRNDDFVTRKRPWYQTRFKPHRIRDVEICAEASRSSPTLWEKISPWKRHSRSNSGFRSEPRAGSPDSHGSVVQMSAHFEPLFRLHNNISKHFLPDDETSGQHIEHDSHDRNLQMGKFLSPPSGSGRKSEAIRAPPAVADLRSTHKTLTSLLSSLSCSERDYWYRSRDVDDSRAEIRVQVASTRPKSEQHSVV